LGEDAKFEVRRLGFLANELSEALPSHISNVVIMGQDGKLKMDYSRLSTILWSVAKTQQEQIENLTTRLDALEKPKKKGANKIPQ